MTEAEAFDFVNSHVWAFASTMPKVPHWYLLKTKVRDQQEFEQFVRLINNRGVWMLWYRNERKYLDIAEYRYWVIEKSLKSVRLINREFIATSKCEPLTNNEQLFTDF